MREARRHGHRGVRRAARAGARERVRAPPRATAALGTDRAATESLEDRAAGTRLRAIAAREGSDFAALFARPGEPPDELLGLVDDHALAIADCLAFLSPTLVVVGGGLVEMPGCPWARLRSTPATHASIPHVFERTRIVRAALGWRAALHGTLAEARAALSTQPSTAPDP